jgi:hypothetical protein
LDGFFIGIEKSQFCPLREDFQEDKRDVRYRSQKRLLASSSFILSENQPSAEQRREK